MEVRELIKNRVVVFDGAMGTMLQKKGLKLGENPEIINFTNEDIVVDIHKEYIKAGADIITTNTFGANEIKLKNTKYSVEEVIRKGVSLSKKAIGDKNTLVALDIGPIGELIEPMGTLAFDTAINIFKTMIKAGVEAGVDLLLIETMTNLYEMKAAILACKEESELPVFATMTFEEDGRTFTGCLPESMAITLEGLGVDALGINCSLGPKELLPILNRVISNTNIPVIVQPNAGLPKFIDNEAIYDITPLEFKESIEEFIKNGASIIGGCCGTTPEFIRELSKLKDLNIKEREKIKRSFVTTHSKVIEVNEVRVVGERINPTGKKIFKEALKKKDIDYILRQAIEQVEAGADLLDINVGLPEINEEEMMVNVIKEVQSILDIPLQIDSNNPKVIEKALRYYNGKPIVNSVNGDNEVLDSILPIVKKYGAAILKGLKNSTKDITIQLLKSKNELEIINDYLIPALDKVGKKYESSEIFLPQLIQATETVKVAFDIIKDRIILSEKENSLGKGKIILATVQGDIHDIGKNIVKVILENYGYDIIDLGKDVPVEKVVDEALKNDVKLVGLSALMTTTIKYMEITIEELKNKGFKGVIMVGGAVVTEEYAEKIGADYYVKDTNDSVKVAKEVFRK